MGTVWEIPTRGIPVPNPIYNIDEIARLGEDKLVSELHMTLGNAAFLFGAVQKEMKKVDRSNGKTKKPCLG
jgi:hypothetical protein